MTLPFVMCSALPLPVSFFVCVFHAHSLSLSLSLSPPLPELYFLMEMNFYISCTFDLEGRRDCSYSELM